jgi:hypothetical protein
VIGPARAFIIFPGGPPAEGTAAFEGRIPVAGEVLEIAGTFWEVVHPVVWAHGAPRDPMAPETTAYYAHIRVRPWKKA